MEHRRRPRILKWLPVMHDGIVKGDAKPLDWIASNEIVQRSRLRSLVTTMRSKCEKHSCLERPETDVIPCVVA